MLPKLTETLKSCLFYLYVIEIWHVHLYMQNFKNTTITELHSDPTSKFTAISTLTMNLKTNVSKSSHHCLYTGLFKDTSRRFFDFFKNNFPVVKRYAYRNIMKLAIKYFISSYNVTKRNVLAGRKTV